MMFISEGKVIIRILVQQESQLGTLYEPCQAKYVLFMSHLSATSHGWRRKMTDIKSLNVEHLTLF